MATQDETEALGQRIAQLEQRLRRTETRTAAETAFWALMHNLFPDEARKHLKAAGREQLLAGRAYIDLWVKKLDERNAEAATAGPRHENIEVE
jgi:hypothetical protein